MELLPFSFWQTNVDAPIIISHDVLKFNSLSLQTSNSGKNTIYWGDGTRTTVNSANVGGSHTYSISGNYSIRYARPKKITSLSATVDYFTSNLTDRVIIYNEKMYNLYRVSLNNVPVESLDFSNNPNMQDLYVYHNAAAYVYKTTSMNINGNNIIRDVSIQGTNITTIDVSNNNTIKFLDAYYNTQNSGSRISTINFKSSGNSSLLELGLVCDTGISIDTTKITEIKAISLKDYIPSTLNFSSNPELCYICLDTNGTTAKPFNTIVQTISTSGNTLFPDAKLGLRLAGSSTESTISINHLRDNINLTESVIGALVLGISDVTTLNHYTYNGIDTITWNLYPCRYIDVSQSGLSSANVSSIISYANRMAIEKNSSGLLNERKKAYGGVLFLGGIAFDSSWTDPLSVNNDIKAQLNTLITTYGWYVQSYFFGDLAIDDPNYYYAKLEVSDQVFCAKFDGTYFMPFYNEQTLSDQFTITDTLSYIDNNAIFHGTTVQRIVFFNEIYYIYNITNNNISVMDNNNIAVYYDGVSTRRAGHKDDISNNGYKFVYYRIYDSSGVITSSGELVSNSSQEIPQNTDLYYPRDQNFSFLPTDLTDKSCIELIIGVPNPEDTATIDSLYPPIF